MRLCPVDRCTWPTNLDTQLRAWHEKLRFNPRTNVTSLPFSIFLHAVPVVVIAMLLSCCNDQDLLWFPCNSQVNCGSPGVHCRTLWFKAGIRQGRVEGVSPCGAEILRCAVLPWRFAQFAFEYSQSLRWDELWRCKTAKMLTQIGFQWAWREATFCAGTLKDFDLNLSWKSA